MDALKALLSGGRVIAFYPALSKACGGIHEAILLQQLIHWCKDLPDDEWFWHTTEQIEEETTINRYQQDKARVTLKEKKLIETKVSGLPPRMHYRINWEVLQNLLSTLDKSICSPSTNRNVDGQQILNRNNEKKEREEKTISRKPTKIDEQLTLSEDWITAAKALGVEHDVHWQFDLFMDHHINKQDTAIDWRRSWQTWCRKAVSWGARGPKPTQGCSAPPPDPAVQRLDYLTTGKWRQNPSDVMRYNGEFGQKNLDREITQIQAMIGNG
jgi:hypothetical protein